MLAVPPRCSAVDARGDLADLCAEVPYALGRLGDVLGADLGGLDLRFARDRFAATGKRLPIPPLRPFFEAAGGMALAASKKGRKGGLGKAMTRQRRSGKAEDQGTVKVDSKDVAKAAKEWETSARR